MGTVPPTARKPQANTKTTDWVKERLRRHYASAPLLAPDRLSKREFGFMFWGPGLMQRHVAFGTVAELRDFLARRAPMHVYNSSAYYERPEAPTMDEKAWLGADLIFDLDADHIPKAREMTYEEMLEAVRRKIIQLHDEFLVQDFGFDERSLRVVFSGGRGYHIHVHDERVWTLGSRERREIVDYITGKELDTQRIFKESVFDAKEFRGRTTVTKKLEMIDPREAVGWERKVVRGLQQLAKALEPPVGIEKAIEFLSSFEGVDREDARALWNNLFEPRAVKPRLIRGIDRLVDEGPFSKPVPVTSRPTSSQHPRVFVSNIETLQPRNIAVLISIIIQLQQVRIGEHKGVPLDGIVPRGETDEPVTSDIKRLIRMPSSIHGKSGLEVIPLKRDALDDFRPLRDAVPKAYTDEPVSMRIMKSEAVNLRDETFNLSPGLTTIPEFAAVFLACRQVATLA